MKRFKARQTYLLFILILSVFLITGCGGGGGEGTSGHWLPSNAPTVTSTDPADAATGVCANKLVTAVFSKAMDASTITAAGTFTVKETVSGNNKPGVVTYNTTTKTATFTRTTNYTAGLSYTATITTAAKDTDGNALATNKVWSFTTGATVCANPVPPGIPDPASCAGPGPLDLGSAATYAVLAGTSYTISLNPTSITGDVGSPSITIPAGVFTLVGTMRDAGTDPSPGAIQTAVTDMQTAVTCANNRSCTVNYAAATDFGGMTLGPGVYCVTGAINITGTLSLNAPGVYIFRASGVGTLDAAAGAIVQLTGTATAANTSVFWVPVGATTLAANTTFLGTIMENSAAITVGADTTLLGGRALSGAAVTSTNNDIIEIP